MSGRKGMCCHRRLTHGISIWMDHISQKLKINEASVRVDRTQFDLDSIADVKTVDCAIKLAFRPEEQTPVLMFL